MSDRNLYFQMLNNNRQQRKLQRPLLRGNYIPERKDDEPFYGNAVVQKHQLSFGGADKNLFFQMQEKGKVRLVPFMLKRQFKDLEPQSRIIGSLDTTKEERQASSLVKGIQNISSLLSSFLSEPETDSVGNIVLDSEGNPKYKTRSMQDQLLVARDAVKLMLQEVQVPSSDLQSKVIDTFDVDDSKSILSKAETVISHGSWDESSQEEKSSIMSEILMSEATDLPKITIHERELTEDELSDNGDELSGEESDNEIREKYILDNTKLTGEMKKDGFPSEIYEDDWNNKSREDKKNVIDFIVKRAYILGQDFRNYQGHEVSFKNMGHVLGQGFRNHHILDFKNLRMVKKFDPKEEF